MKRVPPIGVASPATRYATIRDDSRSRAAREAAERRHELQAAQASQEHPQEEVPAK